MYNIYHIRILNALYRGTYATNNNWCNNNYRNKRARTHTRTYIIIIHTYIITYILYIPYTLCRRACTAEWLGVHTSHIILPVPIYRGSLVGPRIPVICIIYIIMYVYTYYVYTYIAATVDRATPSSPRRGCACVS